MKISKRKIVIIAPNSYGIDKSICRTFESFGFEVTLKNTRNRLALTETLSLKTVNKFPSTGKLLNKNIRSYLERDNEEYLCMIKKIKPDMLFVIKGETIFPETLKLIKEEMKIPCLAYIWDCPFYSYTAHIVDDYRKNNFVRGMHLYDYIFVYDPFYVQEIKKRGISNVSYLPLATDPDQYRKIDVNQNEKREFSFDICFIGSPYPNRMEILDSLSEFNLGVFGDGWDGWYRLKKSPPYYKGKAIKEKVLKIYSSSKIVLNIHDPEATYGVNTRTFDIPACGAFELVDYKRELENLFKVGEEIIYYKDIMDLKRLIRFYLDRPEERHKIAEKGKDKVLNCHTWYNRIKIVIDVLADRGLA